MKIDRIELFHVSIPLGKPFHPAWIPGYPQTANRFTLARLTTNEGIQGIAAGVAFEREREGLGIEIDPDKLARYGEKFFDITTRGVAIKTIREKGFFTALRLARKKRKRSIFRG